MLILLLLNIFGVILSIILFPFPTVSVIPFGIDEALLTAVGYWNQFLIYFWPLDILWQFVLYYLSIKIALIGLRLILGNRVPTIT